MSSRGRAGCECRARSASPTAGGDQPAHGDEPDRRRRLGLQSALREATEIDPRYGGYLNCDLADYVIAVNADIGEIEVGLINQPDPQANSMGIKGLGEVVLSGASAAVVNAIHHATGRRIRHMPVRIEDLL